MRLLEGIGEAIRSFNDLSSSLLLDSAKCLRNSFIYCFCTTGECTLIKNSNLFPLILSSIQLVHGFPITFPNEYVLSVLTIRPWSYGRRNRTSFQDACGVFVYTLGPCQPNPPDLFLISVFSAARTELIRLRSCPREL